ncbi:hypothetical protein JCM16307_15500 [Thermococcus prieurii]
MVKLSYSLEEGARRALTGGNTLENGKFGSKPFENEPIQNACLTLMKLFIKKSFPPALAKEAFEQSFTKSL